MGREQRENVYLDDVNVVLLGIEALILKVIRSALIKHSYLISYKT